MKNYDISQNGIDRYQDEVDRMEETEADEPEDIDYDEVDFRNRMTRKYFEHRMKNLTDRWNWSKDRL